MSGGTVEAPGQPSRPSHRQHVDSQVLRANHTPQQRQQGLCLPPFPESGSGLSKEHSPLKKRGCAGPWKARSPGSAGTILQLIQAPMSKGGGSLIPAAHSPISLKFIAILAFIPSPRPGPHAQESGRLSHLSPGKFCFLSTSRTFSEHLLCTRYYARRKQW